MNAYNVTRNRMLIEQGTVADNAWSRLRGLIGRRPLEAGQGIMIKPCNSVHTFFMGFPIDVVYVSDSGEVVGLAQRLAPNRIGPIVRKASFVLELPAGTIEQTATRPGDRVRIERQARSTPRRASGLRHGEENDATESHT